MSAPSAGSGSVLNSISMRGFPEDAELVQVFERQPEKSLRLRALMRQLGLDPRRARAVKSKLRQLVNAGKIVAQKDNSFALASRPSRAPQVMTADATSRGANARPSNAVTGRLVGHRDGYGFVVPDRPVEGTEQDIFIPRGATGPAMHGDRVEALVTRLKPAPRGRRGAADGGLRLEGRVTRVLDRAQKTVVGEFRADAHHYYVLPYDHRIAHEILIPRGAERPRDGDNARERQFGGESEGRRASRKAEQQDAHELNGTIVDVEITSYPAPGAPPKGRVIEVLGRREDFGVDVEIIIRKFHLPHRFPREVLEAAENAPQFISERELEGRRDFRSVPVVTIDGETAKDFDDAVHVERRKEGGYRLQVHIADVAHYVRPGTALDREARLRGTSVYFPDRAVPMLPLELSNGICSLNPRVERLTMSAVMDLDARGRITNYELVPGVIRSAERMTYTGVRDVLAGDPAALERYRPLVASLRLMEELAMVLNRRREERGSIDFDLPEPEIEFDAMGRMVGVTRSERTIAHRIIEEFMLAANETVAAHLEGRGVPAIYRIHEKPDAKKVLDFEAIAATFGYSLGVELPASERFRIRGRDDRERPVRFHERPANVEIQITPHHYQRLTRRLEGKPEERILSYLMLRSLKQARYTEENLGHFALATPAYTHFTSPIRRYPDLIVHRILKAALKSEKGSAGDALPSREALRTLGIETSEAERRAQDAERELMELKKVAFMAERVGDEFEALIISLIKHGFFVELTDLFIEGFVPFESFEDDRYIYREQQRAAVGERSHRAYHLGDRVRVRLDRIDEAGSKLQFSVAEGNAPARKKHSRR